MQDGFRERRHNPDRERNVTHHVAGIRIAHRIGGDIMIPERRHVESASTEFHDPPDNQHPLPRGEVEAIVNTVEKMTVEKQKNFLMFLWMWLHFNDKPDKPAGAA